MPSKQSETLSPLKSWEALGGGSKCPRPDCAGLTGAGHQRILGQQGSTLRAEPLFLVELMWLTEDYVLRRTTLSSMFFCVYWKLYCFWVMKSIIWFLWNTWKRKLLNE